MSVDRVVKIELFKVKVSRFVRGTYRKIKDKLQGYDSTAAQEVFGEDVRPMREINREKKFKSTAMIFMAIGAMGVSHVATYSVKYGVKILPKSTLVIGFITGSIGAYIWYNYVDAAYDDVGEEDVEMIFEFVTSCGYGNLNPRQFESEHEKALDIIHTIVTGKEQDVETGISIGYEKVSSEDGSDNDEPVDPNNTFVKKIDFENETYGGNPKTTSASMSVFESDPEEGSSKKPKIIPNPFGNIGLDKALDAKPTRSRSSFIPSYDDDDSLDEKNKKSKAAIDDDWLDVQGD